MEDVVDEYLSKTATCRCPFVCDPFTNFPFAKCQTAAKRPSKKSYIHSNTM